MYVSVEGVTPCHMIFFSDIIILLDISLTLEGHMTCLHMLKSLQEMGEKD